MTSDRAQAYGRVTRTLGDLGPSKLLPEELELVRESADVLFFSEDVTEAHRALETCRVLANRLVESERWLPETAARLIADLEACGPLEPVA
jgi:hypothetical protein